MTKIYKKAILLLLVFSMLAGIAAAFPVSAAESSGSSQNSSSGYTQKIVSVLFDNSTSMSNDGRLPAARYSLEILMSLLDERDIMYIAPMNIGSSAISNVNDCIKVELDEDKMSREKAIDQVMNNGRLGLNGATPSRSMETAIRILSEKHGLKGKGEINDPDKEYWFVILTDGMFENDRNEKNQAEKIEGYIKNYPTLKTVYISFGGGVDLSGQRFMDQYLFTPYQTDEDGLAGVIQEVSNQISGRYPISTDYYKVSSDKKTVTVDVDKLEFPLVSLSLIAQNCGAIVQKAKYKGDDISIYKSCSIDPEDSLANKMLSAVSCEVKGDPYFTDGSVVFEFSSPIKEDEFSLFATPALDIEYYIEAKVDGKWEKVTPDYISQNLYKDDKIRVGYVVTDPSKASPNNVVDLKAVFGEVKATTFYDKTTRDIAEEIPLSAGSHELLVEVSVMDGKFSMRDSVTLVVEESPDSFRVEVEGNKEISSADKPAEAIFTVYVNKAPATKELLKDYSIKISVYDSGKNDVAFTQEMGSDGKIKVSMPIEEGKFDKYTFKLEITSPTNVNRSASLDVVYFPSSLTLTLTGADHLSITQYDLKKNEEGFTFLLSTGSLPFPFDNGITEYTLLVDGQDVSKYATIERDKLTFVPTADNLKKIVDNPGDKKIQLILTSKAHPNLNTQAEATLTVIKTVYEVIALSDLSKPTIDRFAPKKYGDAMLCFAVLRDGKAVPLDELKELYKEGKIKIDKPFVFKAFFLPCGAEPHVEEIDGQAVITMRAQRKMPKFFAWHYSAFIFGSEKEIAVTLGDSTAKDSFEFVDSGAFGYVLRMLLLVLEHAFVVYVIIYIIGFGIAKPLPSGYFIAINMSGNIRYTPVNKTFFKKYGWHLLRFLIPTRVLKCQSVKGQCPAISGMDFGYDPKHKIHMKPTGKNIYSLQTRDATAQDILETLHTRTKAGNLPAALRNCSDTERELSEIFKKDEGPFEQKTVVTMSSESYFTRYLVDPDTGAMTITTAVGFLKD